MTEFKKISGKIIIEKGNAFFESTVFKKRYLIKNLGKVSPDNAFCFIKTKEKPNEPGFEIAFNECNVIGNVENSNIMITKITNYEKNSGITVFKKSND